MTRFRRTPGGIAEVPEVCPAGHVDPDGNPRTTPGWGGCGVCDQMGRQWGCQAPGCRWVVQTCHQWQRPTGDAR
ncbi:hypothetical protein [Micromonospora sp. DT229]|uniref:hypothetical protein n=1 Tax=Micromonospora sp. DT229 TaxID=3393430 RepID=UPI003CFB4B0A